MRSALPADEAVVETNTYDGNGNSVSQTDAEGRETRFAYDAANRLAVANRRLRQRRGRDHVVKRRRRRQLVEERDARAAADRRAVVVEAARTTSSNRVETETNGEGNVTRYGYDAEGNRTSVTAPSRAGRPVRVRRARQAHAGHPAAGCRRRGQRPSRPTPTTRTATASARPTRTATSVAMEYDDAGPAPPTHPGPGGHGEPGGLDLVTETRYDENGNAPCSSRPQGPDDDLDLRRAEPR